MGRDIAQFEPHDNSVSPIETYRHHTAIVNDVQYHPLHPALIGTVSDDFYFHLIDTRQDSTTQSSLGEKLHEDVINGLAFHPSSEYFFVTASGDKSVGLWDLRQLKFRLHSLEGHQEAVTSLAWHPFEPSILGSASYDRRVIFWDVGVFGTEQSPEDIDDGPPELCVFFF